MDNFSPMFRGEYLAMRDTLQKEIDALRAKLAAALRVLARMSSEYHLYRGDSDWFVMREPPFGRRRYYEGDTPCEAICAAWADEFGGGK